MNIYTDLYADTLSARPSSDRKPREQAQSGIRTYVYHGDGISDSI
jgi:hypothetical protein